MKKKKGRRAKKQTKSSSLIEVTRGDLTAIGEVDMYDPDSNTITVSFTDGEKVVLPLATAKTIRQPGFKPSTRINIKQPGFNQYEIEWKDGGGEVLNFSSNLRSDSTAALTCRLSAHGVNFYGSYRKTKTFETDEIFHVIDLYASWDEEHYVLPPVPYSKDPRVPRSDPTTDDKGKPTTVKYKGIIDLNADICAAVNKWLFYHLGGNIQTISDLKNKAQFPTITFTSFQSLRKAITDLHDLFYRSSFNGGSRCISIKGDKKGEPELRINVNFTALLVERGYRPDVSDPPAPPQELGVTLTTEGIGGKKSKGRRSRKSSIQVGGSVEVLSEELAKIKAKPKSERTADEEQRARKIRAQLRKLNHFGGTRKKSK